MATDAEAGEMVTRCDECGERIEEPDECCSVSYQEPFQGERHATWRPGAEHFVPVVERAYPGVFHVACADSAKVRLDAARAS